MASKVIAMFNHKGGVSKTTSAFNIGWNLANRKKRVLLVDGDSQCNLTGLILGDNFTDYYTNEETKKNNLYDGVQPAFAGGPNPITGLKCVQTE